MLCHVRRGEFSRCNLTRIVLGAVDSQDSVFREFAIGAEYVEARVSSSF